MLWLEQGQGEEAARRNRPAIMVTAIPTNMGDIASVLLSHDRWAADRTVTLTLAEVKADVRRIARDCDRLAKLAEQQLVDQVRNDRTKKLGQLLPLPSNPPLPSRNFIVAIADPGGTRERREKRAQNCSAPLCCG